MKDLLSLYVCHVFQDDQGMFWLCILKVIISISRTKIKLIELLLRPGRYFGNHFNNQFSNNNFLPAPEFYYFPLNNH